MFTFIRHNEKCIQKVHWVKNQLMNESWEFILNKENMYVHERKQDWKIF